MGSKQVKDPIYGYVTIPTEYISQIIDKNVFQRLRRIIQTSYSPLYPSAIHNRFAHSIGVFHLGQIASNTVFDSLKNTTINNDIDWARIVKIFNLACLLHDVGHAPFSHTGEKFFLDITDENKRYSKLHENLIKAVNTESLKNDIPKEDSKAAAPHEIMSAIIGINEFKEQFNSDFEKEFFARCITGYCFSSDKQENSMYNCFISLLNSKVIDVDRLDYLIRDAYFTGFETVNIDYVRLLTSLTIIETIRDDGEKRYKLAYNKNAISIIENVVYAHDSERKWIQTHPAVLYDMYIIQHILNSLNSTFLEKDISLFSIEALSPIGLEIAPNQKISLLCDDDIVFLLKNNSQDELFNEFFSRNTRRHPLWKSESEYKAFLSLQYGGNALKSLENAFDETEKYLRKYSESWIINDSIIDKIEKELEKIKSSSPNDVDEKSRNKQLKTKETILKLLTCMRKYVKERGCSCDFVILKSSQFYSTFNKIEFAKIPIIFKSKKKNNVFDFEQIVSTLSSSKENEKDFFYLYFKCDKKCEFDKEEFCKVLYQEFM